MCIRDRNGVLDGVKVVLKETYIDIRNRDGVAKTIKQNYKESEEDLFADLFDLPSIA